MTGMKITLSSAMRARDVSRPQPEDLAAAEEADEKASAPGRGGSAGGFRGSTGGIHGGGRSAAQAGRRPAARSGPPTGLPGTSDTGPRQAAPGGPAAGARDLAPPSTEDEPVTQLTSTSLGPGAPMPGSRRRTRKGPRR